MKIDKKTIKNISAGLILVAGLFFVGLEPVVNFIDGTQFGIKLKVIMGLLLFLISIYLIKQNNL